ncbi:hypothetical protein Agub_g14746 [Astrephomene gubernaculifera]|uniref:MPN domain-containing protein n=1 Tax=Astrephomene gubernaculifera TaxID=47775 RepID=A0AAD3HTC1_9CHLO|nr:hypothetical protein Agub_g14746 [Astrephomene gubernaculifera]
MADTHRAWSGGANPPSAQFSYGRANNGADDSGTDTDDEGRLIQQAAATAKMRDSEPPQGRPAAFPTSARPPPMAAPPAALPPSRAAPPPPRPAPRPPAATTGKGKAAPKRPAGAITLRTLLDAGFLVPGSKVLYVEYKGIITWADLTEEGSIICDGQTFESPSAFSISVKRKLNPERKADDGWKAVKYAGKLLEHFKEQYLRQQLAASGLGGGGGGGGATAGAGAAMRAATPSGGWGAGGGVGRPSPHSSGHPSPLRDGAGDEDGPPNKRQRTDGDDAAPGSGGSGGSRPGLKIKLKLKDGQGGATPGGRQPPTPARTGPLMPLPAPPLAVIPCGSYMGSPGSGEPEAQPFRVEVSDMVLIVMDFHAHVSSAEVGGLLGGTYDEASRTLTITRAFPVLELPPLPPALAGPEGRAPVAVEFDPTDLARVREVIRSWGLRCVGSYRSHPAYAPTPNALDVRQAARAQQESRTHSGAEPCVCAIVAPYDPASPNAPASDITWFHVEYDRSRPLPPLPSASAPVAPPAGCRPMALMIETAEHPTSHMDIMNLVSTQFQHTARTYAVRPTRTPLALQWRPMSQLPYGARPQTCLDKLVSSVVSRLPDMFEGDLGITYGNMVRDMVQHEFALAERMNQQRPTRGSSEDGGAFYVGEGRARRAAARNNNLIAAARFESEEEETEEEDDEVKLDDDDEAYEDDD